MANIEVFLSLFKQRLGDTYLQEWHTELSKNGKLEMYVMCTNSFSTLTRFRCANHNLAINKLRRTHGRVDRICKYCHEKNNELN